jgi:pyruvate formate lyase activating enzyme
MHDLSPVYSYLKNPTFIDYPGKIAAVFFTSGCNFKCGFCHNYTLIQNINGGIEWDKIKLACDNFSNNWVDGIVLTGGEPTIHESLPKLIDLLNKYKFSIKLDTNGSSPDVLLNVIKKINYVAMDIKCSLERYDELVGYKDIENILKSIELIKNKAIDYEFRTTVIEKIHTEKEMIEIAKIIRNCKKYVLQQFVPQKDLPNVSFRNETRTSMEYIEKIKTILLPIIPNTTCR